LARHHPLTSLQLPRHLLKLPQALRRLLKSPQPDKNAKNNRDLPALARVGAHKKARDAAALLTPYGVHSQLINEICWIFQVRILPSD
jgi:hypothetical protein